jgi:hypothetical protein
MGRGCDMSMVSYTCSYSYGYIGVLAEGMYYIYGVRVRVRVRIRVRTGVLETM